MLKHDGDCGCQGQYLVTIIIIIIIIIIITYAASVIGLLAVVSAHYY